MARANAQGDKSSSSTLTDAQLDQIILKDFPHPIATNYAQMLRQTSWEARTRKALEVFEFGVRIITLNVLSQYLIYDMHLVTYAELDRKLYKQLPQASLGQWVEFFFMSLKAYQGRRDRFFIHELYDLYWDTRFEPHHERRKVRGAYNQLVEIRNDLAHRIPPENEDHWRILCEKVENCLREVFRQFSFIKEYTLIRLKTCTGETCQYESYRGQQITLQSGLIKSEDALHIGWFYLLQENGQVLALHPLLVFWGDDGNIDQSDAAVYDRLLKETVEYVALVLRRMVSNADVEQVALVRNIIYYNLEKIKLSSKNKQTLSWNNLLSASRALSDEQIETIREKFQPKVYLQRQNILEAFYDFLASEKNCFVLIGESGSGKSSFVLSLREIFSKQTDNPTEQAAFFFYNAARSNPASITIDGISADLGRFLNYESGATSVLKEMEQSGELYNHKVVLVFDGLNENVDAQTLMRQIDVLVSEKKSDWLKVIVTSRSEAWRQISNNLPLAENLYYRNANQRDTDDTIRLAIRLVPFADLEFEKAYQKYQDEYQLQTSLTELGPHTQQLLHNPLMLCLVAEVYRGGAIPISLHGNEVEALYIKMLISTRRLSESDLFFLQSELMPLMLSNEHFENRIVASQIRQGHTTTSKPLWELLLSDDLLSNGERVNAAFTRLVDAGILNGQGTALDYEVSFKFERFYEYFGSLRLYDLYCKQADQVGFILKLLTETQYKVYLLNLIYRCLLLDLEAGNKHTLFRLCRAGSIKASDISLSVLQSHAEHNRSGVLDFALQLTRGINWDGIPLDQDMSAGIVALRLGGWLHQPQIVAIGLRAASSTLQMEAVQQAYLIWKANKKMGWELLGNLISEIMGVLNLHHLPSVILHKQEWLNRLESAGWFSANILLNHHDNAEIAIVLQRLWRPLIARVLFKFDGAPFLDKAINLGRDVILSVLIDLVASRLKSSPKRYNPASITEIAHFYTLPLDTRDKTYALTQYFDPKLNSLARFEEQILELLPTQNGMVNQIIGHTLVVQGQAHLPEILNIIRKVFYHGINSAKPGVISGNMLWVLSTLIRRQNPIDESTFALLEELILTSAKEVREWHSPLGTYANVWFDDYARIYVRHHESSQGNIIIECAQKAAEQNDTLMMLDLLYTLGRLADSDCWRLAMDVVRVLGRVPDTEIRNRIVDFLAHMRVRHQGYVDNFLELHFADTDLPNQVQFHRTEETIFYTLGGGSGPWVSFITDILHSEAFLLDRMWITQQITKNKTFKQAMKQLVRWGINKIYGGVIFKITEHLPI